MIKLLENIAFIKVIKILELFKNIFRIFINYKHILPNLLAISIKAMHILTIFKHENLKSSIRA